MEANLNPINSITHYCEPTAARSFLVVEYETDFGDWTNVPQVFQNLENAIECAEKWRGERRCEVRIIVETLMRAVVWRPNTRLETDAADGVQADLTARDDAA